MNEQDIERLVSLGFTYEELFKKGLLVIKASDTVQNAQAGSSQPAEESVQDAQEQTVEEDTYSVDAALSELRDELKNLRTQLHQKNAQDNVRGEEKQLSLEAAIHGLATGGK